MTIGHKLFCVTITLFINERVGITNGQIRFLTFKKYLCVGSHGLPAPQGTSPDYQPGLHRDQGGQRVHRSLEMTLAAFGCDQAHVLPRLLSDNGSSYISGNLAEWLDAREMTHFGGAPYHPQTRARSSGRKKKGINP